MSPKALEILASAVKLGLRTLPPGLSLADKRQLAKLGVQLPTERPETRGWRLR